MKLFNNHKICIYLIPMNRPDFLCKTTYVVDIRWIMSSIRTCFFYDFAKNQNGFFPAQSKLERVFAIYFFFVHISVMQSYFVDDQNLRALLWWVQKYCNGLKLLKSEKRVPYTLGCVSYWVMHHHMSTVTFWATPTGSFINVSW